MGLNKLLLHTGWEFMGNSRRFSAMILQSTTKCCLYCARTNLTINNDEAECGVCLIASMAAATTRQKALQASLCLPKTKFPMRANAAVRELASVDKLTIKSYRQQVADRTAQNQFVLHDGPPYANGSLHMGHFLNKVLKDIINRQQLLQGKRVVYIPGWDCHGMPIEHKALKELGFESANRRAELTPLTVRQYARDCAAKAVKEQAADFQRWGVLGDWDLSSPNHYLTMHPTYEAAELGELFF